MILVISCVAAFFLAYANGANDNFKGVATLYGSGTATYRTALLWATFTTAIGSVLALIFAHGLLATFSGKGLVPDAVVAMKSFALAVVFAAAGTVMLATRLGFPISTTHALTGALVGAGLLASPEGVHFGKLGSAFFAPLLLSPLIALLLSMTLYPALRFFRVRTGVQKETCLCVGTEVVGVVPPGMEKGQALALYAAEIPAASVGTAPYCVDKYRGAVLAVDAGGTLDKFHFLSGGLVCGARALNDTPKIAALLLLGAAISPSIAIAGVALVMCLGGLANARRIAEMLSHKVTTMSPGQGFTANFVTSVLVLSASKLGLPVSTTHVSCGSLFGIGVISGHAQWKSIAAILVAWVTTLPVAALLGAGFFTALKNFL